MIFAAAAVLTIAALVSPSLDSACAGGAKGLDRFPYPTDTLKTTPFLTRGESELDKLAPELRNLYAQFTGDRRNPSDFAYSDEQLDLIFGIAGDDPQPLVRVSIALADGHDVSALANAGIAVYSVHGNRVMADVPVAGLLRLARIEAVQDVDVVKPTRIPEPPTRAKASFADKVLGMRGEGGFDHQGLTGEGVIVGVVDSGIDWRHGDFVNEDGESRIMYLWDMLDSSYDDSGGTIGNEAPVGIEYMGLDLDIKQGTLYTRDQLNAALAGSGVCNSVDVVGHGTACASIAAGNGLATAYGVPAGTWAGLAPEADLMICRAGDGSFESEYVKAVEWIAETARGLGRPCVINLSLGGHGSAHDGNAAEEQLFNELVRQPGVVICVSAGNEGRMSFHTSGRFGPRAEGQMDVESAPVELFVSETTQLHAYFDAEDDWGFAIAGLNNFLTDEYGNPGVVYLKNVDDSLSMVVSDNLATTDLSEWFAAITFADASNEREVVAVPVLPGSYQVCAFGTTWDVVDGSFDFYLPLYFQASFGRGAVHTRMVGSPGNADGVITVGSYDFRNEWTNWSDTSTRYNLELGGISDYSSPGYRIDGVIKPDLVAPGRFAISAKAAASEMALSGGSEHTTSDGLHLAWEGTSASAPYVSGLVALMLDKNPGLDAAAVKEILVRSATSDRQTGAVPNELWGHGKVNPEAALRATPSP
ncbi:S8 family serine peptidase [bacterium]|nr:S8 family serine peptidase [bacterium]MBU1071980.1 S8 family serine peptidase [bacterium]MBU1675390.1 S8 family serine peptidase [bacterium]